MKKKSKTNNAANFQTLKIGRRVRCTDDGVEGRITWASGTHVKIEWTDGERVTWKRADLASKGIEVLGDAADEPAVEKAAPEPAPEAAPVEQATPAEQAPAEQAAPVEQAATEQPAVAESTTTETATPAAKHKRQRMAAAEPKEKKMSALDAAARVLAETGTPMSCPEMIEVMSAKGYWTSPGGQTPVATLYSPILREPAKKGAYSRFVKTDRGKFGPKS